MKLQVIIYRFVDYKKYLLEGETEFSRFDKGFRARMAEALEVQSAFVSKVFNQSKVHFTIEQAMKLSQFLKLDNDETAYLVWLVEWARAGTSQLKTFFYKLIEAAQTRHLNIKNRVGEAHTLSDEDQSKFYSHWLYGAAHVLTSVPRYTSLEKMSEALRIDDKLMREILVFLVRSGLIVAKEDRFAIGPAQLHLSKDSANISKHHTNWRLKAIDDAADSRSDGIHYSTVSSLSEKDFAKLRHDLTEVIQNYVEVIRKSPEETVCNFNLDFYRLVKN